MKRIIIGTVAVMMTVPCFADPTPFIDPITPGDISIDDPIDGSYSCTMTYSCGNGSGNTQTYTHTDSNNRIITVANSNCSKPGDTFSHWNVSYCASPYTVSNSIAHPGESYNIAGCLDDLGNALCFTAVYASETGENVLTSKPYVDDAVSTRQDKIPAANPSNTNLGETVMTYTDAGDGEIGERELFTGGTYDAANDADKLITASALKSAFTLPETQTTKLVCANPGTCDLWTITEQTAYATTIDLASIMGVSQGTDYAFLALNGIGGNNASTYGMTQNGTWVVDYGNGKRIRGKAQCSSQAGDNNDYTWTNPTISSTLQDASGDYCYCQLDGYTTNGDNWGNMTALSAPWVFHEDEGDWSLCEYSCAQACASRLLEGSAFNLAFRAAVFNSVQ